MNDDLSPRSVQSAITSVSFPESLVLLRKMGLKWLDLVGKDWITDMDILMNFPSGMDITWISPKWLTSGDILFFYHTKRARQLIYKLLKETELLIQRNAIVNDLSVQDVKTLYKILLRQSTLAESFSGTIFGFSIVSGRPRKAFDVNKHFKGTIYAPIDAVYIFKYPLGAEKFADVLRIGQNTITPMYGKQFEIIKEKLKTNNKLPTVLNETTPTSIGFRDIDANNWRLISCNNAVRFIDEAQLRSYHIDYLLDEIKDPRTRIYTECNCYRDNVRTGIADYFIRFRGKWLPVEAKLNVLAEEDILGQLNKYMRIDSFTPTVKGLKYGNIKTERDDYAIVIDQAGLYLVKGIEFINCSPELPLCKREDLYNMVDGVIRQTLIELMEV